MSQSLFCRVAVAFGLMLGIAQPAAAATPYDDLKVGVWREISKNTIDDVDPCPSHNCSYTAVEGISAVIDDWNGGALATGYGKLGGLVAWGGGHNGYFGSEVYVFDLETQLWVRASEPYDSGNASVAPECSSQGTYPDGSACAAHTYDRVDYHPPTNQFVILSATDDPVCGGCDDGYVHTFDFDDKSWGLGPQIPNMAPLTGALSAYDEKRDVFWFLGTYNVPPLRKYDPNGNGGKGAWSEHGEPAQPLDIDGAAIVDPQRDLLLHIDARGSNKLFAFDLANPDQKAVELAVSGDTEIQNHAKLGFEWDPSDDRAVAWHDGAELYVLTPPSGDWKSGTWNWTKHFPDAANTVTPKRNGNGTYSRFQYVPSVNAFVVVSSTSGPVWMVKLSDDPGSGPNTGGVGGQSGGGGGGSAGTASGGSAGTASGGANNGGSSGNTASSADGSDDGGCGCRVGTRSPGSGALLAMLLVACAALTRRRSRNGDLGRANRDSQHLLALVVALLLAGCGSDDSPSGNAGGGKAGTSGSGAATSGGSGGLGGQSGSGASSGSGGNSGGSGGQTAGTGGGGTGGSAGSGGSYVISDCGASLLKDEAAKLSAGSIVELAVSGYDDALIDAGAGHHILQYSDKGVWDPNTCQALFVGGGHLSTVKYIAYSASQNQFFHAANPSWWCDTFAASNPYSCSTHAYGHNALDPATGRMFFRKFNSATVYAHQVDAAIDQDWTQLPKLPSNAAGCIATGIEYFPETDQLVYVDCEAQSLHTSKGGSGAWQEIQGPFAMGPYHNYAVYNPVHKVVLFGLGKRQQGPAQARRERQGHNRCSASSRVPPVAEQRHNAAHPHRRSGGAVDTSPHHWEAISSNTTWRPTSGKPPRPRFHRTC